MITEGILNINKPQNMTSHDVVSVVRRTLGMKKVGHTGTLDPMATGVLPICVGKSTRVIEYMELDMKKYRCTMLLGVTTDTLDIWGKELSRTVTDSVTEKGVREAFSVFSGVIDQKPPIYSALKVNGKRLYEYAREGKDVEIKTRKTFIKALEIEKICLDNPEEKTVTFTVECSKGTYIRTICQDVGIALGCGGTMSGLNRIKSGIFDTEDAIDLDKLKAMTPEEASELFYKTSDPLVNFGKVVVDQVHGVRFVTGWHLPLEHCTIVDRPKYEQEDFCLPIREEYRKAYSVFALMEGKEEFLGVAFYNETYKKLVADKVFYTR